MSRLIKIIDENTIELADYRCPEVIFKSSQNPPTLQNIKDEIEHLEWYCIFKDTINPFQMYEENKRLTNIINELRELVEKGTDFKSIYFKKDKEDLWKVILANEIKEKYLEVLDKGSEMKK